MVLKNIEIMLLLLVFDPFSIKKKPHNFIKKISYI